MEGQVAQLLVDAQDPVKLCRMYAGVGGVGVTGGSTWVP